MVDDECLVNSELHRVQQLAVLAAEIFVALVICVNLRRKGLVGRVGHARLGVQQLEASDMLLLPHAETAKVDPFEEKTVSIIADAPNRPANKIAM